MRYIIVANILVAMLGLSGCTDKKEAAPATPPQAQQTDAPTTFHKQTKEEVEAGCQKSMKEKGGDLANCIKYVMEHMEK